MNTLAEALSTTVLRLRVLETALYGDAVWTMRAPDGVATMATVTVLDRAVSFDAKLEGPLPETFPVVLEADGEPRLVFAARISREARNGDVATIQYRLGTETLISA